MLSSSLLLLLLAAFTNTTIIRQRGRYIWILLISFLSRSLFSLSPFHFFFAPSFVLSIIIFALHRNASKLHEHALARPLPGPLTSHYTNGQIIVLSVPFPASTVSQHTLKRNLQNCPFLAETRTHTHTQTKP